jgi:hypothetical protein
MLSSRRLVCVLLLGALGGRGYGGLKGRKYLKTKGLAPKKPSLTKCPIGDTIVLGGFQKWKPSTVRTAKKLNQLRSLKEILMEVSENTSAKLVTAGNTERNSNLKCLKYLVGNASVVGKIIHIF